MTTPAKFPPDGFAVIAAAPKWLPSTCTYVRGFVVDPRRDGIGILVLESDDASIAIGEVRHLAFAPHLCELDALDKFIVEEDAPADAEGNFPVDDEGNRAKIMKTAQVALSWSESPIKAKNAGNWNVAVRIDAPVRMEEAMQAVLTAREAAKANGQPAPAPAANREDLVTVGVATTPTVTP